jgi:lipoprotein-anchoring transpeptidase ErfK/SrfK
MTRVGHRIELVGRLSPARPGVPVRILRAGRAVAWGRIRRDGTFRVPVRLGHPGPFRAFAAGISSPPVTVVLRPRLELRALPLVQDGVLRLQARLRPVEAGRLRVRVHPGGRPTVLPAGGGGWTRLLLPLPLEGKAQVLVESLPRPGYAPLTRRLELPAYRPRLALGVRARGVRQLLERLAALGYASPPARSLFDEEVLQAVYAFQKAQDLPRSGVVDHAVWARLRRPRPLRPAFVEPTRHIEVDLRRQILLLVHAGRVVLVAPVSTAGIPGYRTPVGRFAIYRKVPGYDPSPLGILYKPMYFHAGYAIHGSPSVPPYPASHGCVRVPRFVIERLFAREPYGEVVYVYERTPASPRPAPARRTGQESRGRGTS